MLLYIQYCDNLHKQVVESISNINSQNPEHQGKSTCRLQICESCKHKSQISIDYRHTVFFYQLQYNHNIESQSSFLGPSQISILKTQCI